MSATMTRCNNASTMAESNNMFLLPAETIRYTIHSYRGSASLSGMKNRGIRPPGLSLEPCGVVCEDARYKDINNPRHNGASPSS